MDIGAFLTAQLALHAVPASTWPSKAGGDGEGNGPNGGDNRRRRAVGGRVILSGAKCCFVLPEHSHEERNTEPHARRRRRPIRFCTRSAQDRQRYERPFPDRDGVNGNGSTVARTMAREERVEAAHAAQHGDRVAGAESCGRSRDGERRAEAGGEEELLLSDTFDFEVAIGEEERVQREECVFRSRDAALAQRGGGGGRLVEGTLLLRIHGAVYEAEYPLIRSIAYPIGIAAREQYNQADDSPRHTKRPRKDSRDNSDRPGCASEVKTSATTEATASVRRKRGRESSEGCNARDIGSAGDGVDDESRSRTGDNRKGNGGHTVRSENDEGEARDAIAGRERNNGVGRGGSSRNGKSDREGVRTDDDDSSARTKGNGKVHLNGVCLAERTEVEDTVESPRKTAKSVSRPGQEESRAPSTTALRKRKPYESTWNEAAEAVGADRGLAEGGNRLEGGEERDRASFCGLSFPGVLLEFWLPRKHGEIFRENHDREETTLSKLQAVVNDMLEGLTPTLYTHPLARETANAELDEAAQSVYADAQDGAGNDWKLTAWDELVDASHSFLVQQLKLQGPENRESRLGEQSGMSTTDAGVEGTGERGERYTDDVHPVLSHPYSPAVGTGTSAPAVDYDAGTSPVFVGRSSEISSASRPGGGRADFGTASALTCLAECFSRASVPVPVRSAVQRRLKAERDLAVTAAEDALDRAFPLDLSQNTDQGSRVSMTSELEACSRRLFLARQASLPLDLLPASDMLCQVDGDPALA